MSPIDDELRAALQGRADRLQPAPDPLTGIEHRAERIRRHRAGAAVAVSVLAVAAIALVVPALSPAAGPDLVPPPVATVAPTPTPSLTSEASPYALDPSDPWPYRGDPGVAVQGDLDAYEAEWAVTHGVLVDDVELVPLFGQVYEPAATPELVYLVRQVSGASWWGVARAGESGPELLVDEPLDTAVTALPAALPGDEVARLLVTAAPEAEVIEYSADPSSYFVAMTELADGVGVRPLDGNPEADELRVLGPDGEIFRGPAPDLASTNFVEPWPRAASPAASPKPVTSPSPVTIPSPVNSGPPVPVAAPDNLLGWPARGARDSALVERAARGYAAAKGVSRDRVDREVLFTGSNDAGQRYTVLNAWVLGQRAQVFGWVETPGRAAEPVLQPLTRPNEPVVAILLTEVPGRTTDELVVVPQPRTGDVFYRTSADDEGRSVVVDGLDGIALVDRARGAQGDSLFVLDGNGDLANPTFDGSVFQLLCGEKGCG